MIYDDEAGFVALTGLVDEAAIAAIAADTDRLLVLPADERLPRDKVSHGTRHLVDVDQRSEAVAAVVASRLLAEVVEQIVGSGTTERAVDWRCPQPGYGSQRLHADDLPKLDRGPDRCATAIVALVDFTAVNGATRVVPGSHRRPDLQRRAGSLDTHPDARLLIGSAGTAFVFSGHLLHSGTRNRSDADRPALQITWRLTS